MASVLDIRTLVLVYVAINTGLALVMAYLWGVQRNYPPAKDWAIGSLMFATGLFLFSLRNIVPPFLTEVVSNVLLLPGLMIFNFGIAKASGQDPSLGAGLAFCVLANAVLAWLYFVPQNDNAMVVAQNLVILLFDLYVVYACLRAKSVKGNYTFLILAALYTMLVVACSWRVAGGVFEITFSFSQSLPRLFWIATSLVFSPMIAVLLTLHTSQRLQEEIHEQAQRDPLTGALNRRGFSEHAAKEWSRSLRHKYPLAILSVDIDNFKNFNDQYGHQMGDVALVAVSRAAQAALRINDIWCRHGGEEFVALLPNTSIDQAMIVSERLRASVVGTKIPSSHGMLSISVSIGAAERAASQTDLNAVLAVSDSALYRAKATGRNRVVAGHVSEVKLPSN